MGTILEGIGIIIFVVVVFFVFILIIQLMSKISGRSIRQSGVSRIVARPTDFNETVVAIKQIKEDIGFQIKKLNLTTNEKIIYKFERVLKGDYSNYSKRYSNYLNLKLSIERLKKKNEEGEKNVGKGYAIIFQTPSVHELHPTVEMYCLETKLFEYHQLFSPENSTKIINFISPSLQNDQTKIVEFLDKLGLENISKFCLVIDEPVEMYLKNKISKEEIEKIKLVILHYKGIIDIVI